MRRLRAQRSGSANRKRRPANAKAAPGINKVDCWIVLYYQQQKGRVMSRKSNQLATTLSITVQKRSLVKGDLSLVVKQVSLDQVAMTEPKATRESMDRPNQTAQ